MAHHRTLETHTIVRDITERKKAQKALAKSERKYRELYENMRDGLVVFSSDGLIVESNPAFQQMLGYSAKELSQMTHENLTPQQWHAHEAKIVRQEVLARGYSEVYEKEYVKRDGSVLPVVLRTYRLMGENGDDQGMWTLGPGCLSHEEG